MTMTSSHLEPEKRLYSEDEPYARTKSLIWAKVTVSLDFLDSDTGCIIQQLSTKAAFEIKLKTLYSGRLRCH